MLLHEPFSSVTPTVDGEVLFRLATLTTPVSLAELSRLIPERSYHGVRNCILRLVAQGIVTQIASGRTSLYQLNREHLAADPVIALARSRERLLERVHELVASWPEVPQFVVLFGSAARGEMSEASDLDFLVLFSGDSEECRSQSLEQLATSIEAWTGNDAEVIDYAVDEVRDRGSEVELLRRVQEEGIFIVGDRLQFRRLVGAK